MATMKIGCDISKMGRFENTSTGFLEKYFTSREIEYINKKYHRTETISGMFAAKEAVFKTFKLDSFPILKDIEVLHENNIPTIKLDGEYEKYNGNIDVSISHDGEYSIAYAVRVE